MTVRAYRRLHGSIKTRITAAIDNGRRVGGGSAGTGPNGHYRRLRKHPFGAPCRAVWLPVGSHATFT